MKIKKLIGLLALTSSIFLTSCGVGPAVKELKKINDENARYWAEFIKKNGINAIDYENDTVLLYALDTNNTDLVKACIKCGADVNLTRKQPPLIVYPVLNKDVELVKLFLSKGAIVIGNNDYQDSLKYIVKGFSQYYHFDEDAKRIIDLLFTKVTLDDINSIAKDNGAGYFAYYSSESISAGSKKAFEAIFDNIIYKGYELTEKDIYNISGFLSREKLHEVILDNLDKVSLHWVFQSVINFEQYMQDGSNEQKYDLFKSILQSIEINESNYSDIDQGLDRLYSLAIVEFESDYHNIDNLLEKIKEIVSLLKTKNYNIQNSNVLYQPGYQFSKTLEYIKNFDRNGFDSSEKVSIIQNSQTIKIVNYLLSEGFPMNEEVKEFYDYYISNYNN